MKIAYAIKVMLKSTDEQVKSNNWHRESSVCDACGSIHSWWRRDDHVKAISRCGVDCNGQKIATFNTLVAGMRKLWMIFFLMSCCCFRDRVWLFRCTVPANCSIARGTRGTYTRQAHTAAEHSKWKNRWTEQTGSHSVVVVVVLLL